MVLQQSHKLALCKTWQLSIALTLYMSTRSCYAYLVYNLLVFRFVKSKMYNTCDINMKLQLWAIDRILYNDYTK